VIGAPTPALWGWTSAEVRHTARSQSVADLSQSLASGREEPAEAPAQLPTALGEVLKNEPNLDWDISAIKSW
jgi:hypothetical protein